MRFYGENMLLYNGHNVSYVSSVISTMPILLKRLRNLMSIGEPMFWLEILSLDVTLWSDQLHKVKPLTLFMVCKRHLRSHWVTALRQTDEVSALHAPSVKVKSYSSRMRVMNHNWSAMKQRLHPQSVAEISHNLVLSWEKIR